MQRIEEIQVSITRKDAKCLLKLLDRSLRGLSARAAYVEEKHGSLESWPGLENYEHTSSLHGKFTADKFRSA